MGAFETDFALQPEDRRRRLRECDYVFIEPRFIHARGDGFDTHGAPPEVRARTSSWQADHEPVTKSGGKVMSSNMISSLNKVILVGTGPSTPSAAAASIGTTVPAGEMQQWAHDYLLSSGYSEADFTATVRTSFS